jgi:hypothetical protein
VTSVEFILLGNSCPRNGILLCKITETIYRIRYTITRDHQELVVAQLAKQFLTRLLRNAKVYFRVHQIPPLDSILSQMNPVHALPSYLYI